MSDLSRRDAVKLAAGLAACAGALIGGKAAGDEKPAASGRPAAQPTNDRALEHALQSPSTFMFSEQMTFKLEDSHSRDLYITSASNAEGKAEQVRVPSASMRIFRADAAVDAFTRQGGVYWQIIGKEGKAGSFRLKEPGALVLIVRDQDDTVRCYALQYDLRC